jgi:hypothetical protein
MEKALCPAPQPEEEKSPLPVMLLVEEPHVVAPKGSKPQKGRTGLRNRETSVTRFEETHASL